MLVISLINENSHMFPVLEFLNLLVTKELRFLYAVSHGKNMCKVFRYLCSLI